MRSSPCASDRTGGSVNSFGTTDHSFASSTGISVIPSVTWTPWLRRYSQGGFVGQEKR